MAPIAPIEPAWFTVAIPINIDPRTANINASGGIITIITFIQNLKSNSPLKGTGGADLGLILAYTNTYNM